MATEEQNTREVMRLNQRGGRTMSIIDLCRAGTLTPGMAALCWIKLERSTSLLTGAVPGGAGKTTLMAALLGFLPAGEHIATVADRSVLDAALQQELPEPATLLAHEIGSGGWYGYIWGRDAADFFRCVGPAVRCVSCLHSDDPNQTREMLLPLGVRSQDLQQVGLQLYIQRTVRHGRRVHRVTSLHCRLDGKLRQLTEWDHASDRHEFLLAEADICAALTAEDQAHEQLQQEWSRRRELLQALDDSGVTDWPAVRQAVVERPLRNPE